MGWEFGTVHQVAFTPTTQDHQRPGSEGGDTSQRAASITDVPLTHKQQKSVFTKCFNHVRSDDVTT